MSEDVFGLAQEEVSGYTKVVNGQTVQVKSHTRANNDMSTAANKVAGRPQMVATGGSFAGGRGLPGVWANEIRKKLEAEMPEPEDDEFVEPEPESVTEAASRVLESLDEFRETVESRKIRELIAALPASMELSGDVIELAKRRSETMGKVLVKGHMRTYTTRDGIVKTIHVKPFRRAQKLVSWLGGPDMAAKRGFSTDLMVSAMAEDNRIKAVRKAPVDMGKVRKAAAVGDRGVSSSTKGTVKSAKGRVAVKAPTIAMPPEGKSFDDIRYFDSKAKRWMDRGEWERNNGAITSPMQSKLDSQMRKAASNRGLAEDSFLSKAAPDAGKVSTPKADSSKPDTPKTSGDKPGTPKPGTPKADSPKPSGDKPKVGTPKADSPKPKGAADETGFANPTPLTPEEKKRWEARRTRMEKSGFWINPNLDTWGDGQYLAPYEVGLVERDKLADLYRWENAEIDDLPDVNAATEKAWKLGFERPEGHFDNKLMSTNRPDVGGGASQGTPTVAEGREFVHPSGVKIQLEAGEVLKQHVANDESFAVFGADGVMKYRIMPTGSRGAPLGRMSATNWAVYSDKGSVIPKKVSTDVGSEYVPKGDKGSTFVHPSGKTFDLDAGDKLYKHKTNAGAYRVEDANGVFKYRISARGKVQTSETKGGNGHYKEMPSTLGRPTTPKPSGDKPKVATPEQPKVSTPNPDTPKPEAPKPEAPKPPPTAPVVFDESQSREWNWGVYQGSQGNRDMSAEQWKEMGIGPKDRTKFRDGLTHYGVQKEAFDGLDNKDYEFTDDFVFDNALFPDGNARLVERREAAQSAATAFSAEDLREAGVDLSDPKAFSKALKDMGATSITDNKGRVWTPFDERWDIISTDSVPGDKAVGKHTLILFQEPVNHPDNGIYTILGNDRNIPDNSTFNIKGTEFTYDAMDEVWRRPDNTFVRIRALYDLTTMGERRPMSSDRIDDLGKEEASKAFAPVLDTLPDNVAAWMHNRVDLWGQGAASPKALGYVAMATGRMTIPKRTMSRADMRTPQNDSAEVLPVYITDLQGVTFDGGGRASFQVPADKFSRLEVTLAHESGHQLESAIQKYLPQDQQKEFYKDLSNVLISRLPQDVQALYPTYQIGQKIGKHTYNNKQSNVRGTYANSIPSKSSPDYEFARALEFVQAFDNSIVPVGLSRYGSTNNREILAEAWAEFHGSSAPRPIASEIGGIMRRAADSVSAYMDHAISNKAVPDAAHYKSAVTSKPVAGSGVAEFGTKLAKGESLNAVDLEGLSSALSTAGRKKVTVKDHNGVLVVQGSGLKITATPNSSGYMLDLDKPNANNVRVHNQLVALMQQDGRKVRAQGSANAVKYGYTPALSGDALKQFKKNIIEDIAWHEAYTNNNAAFWRNLERLHDTSEDSESGYLRRLTIQDIMLYGELRDGGHVLDEHEWFGEMPDTDPSTIRGIAPSEGMDVESLTPQERALLNKAKARGNIDIDALTKAGTTIAMSKPEKDAVAFMEDHDLSDINGKDTREKVARLAVMHIAGLDTTERAIAASDYMQHVRDTFGSIESDPQGMQGYKDWADRNPGFRQIIAKLPSTLPEINDGLIYEDRPEHPHTKWLDQIFNKVQPTTAPMTLWVPLERPTVYPAGTVVKDRRFMKGSRTELGGGAAALKVTVPKGSKVIYDGDGYILPRGMQFDVNSSNTDKGVMDVSPRANVPDLSFVRTVHQRLGPTPKRPEYDKEKIMGMSIADIGALFFGVGIPPDVYMWLLERMLVLPLELLWG